MTIINDEDDLESLQIEAERLGNFYLELIKGDYTREKEEAATPIYNELNIVRIKIAHLKCPTYPNSADLQAKIDRENVENEEDSEFSEFINSSNEDVGPPGELVETIENEQPEIVDGPT